MQSNLFFDILELYRIGQVQIFQFCPHKIPCPDTDDNLHEINITMKKNVVLNLCIELTYFDATQFYFLGYFIIIFMIIMILTIMKIMPPLGADAKAFFDEVLPMFSSIVRDGDLDRFAKQSDSRLPCFSYVGPILHRGRTTCLLGTYVHAYMFLIIFRFLYYPVFSGHVLWFFVLCIEICILP